MKIFITGGTGFIGSHLIQRLSQTDHQLVCLVRKMDAVSEQLKAQGAEIVMGDVLNKESIHKGMQDCDWVFHLAGVYTYWEPDQRIYNKINVEGTRNVMECALENKVSKVVHVSTVGIYGKPGDSPFTEESQVGPERFSRYFQSKYEGDQVVWDLHKNKGLPVVVVYPCAVLGPNDPKATGQYIQNLMNKRMPARVFEDAILTFVHVKDVADVIVRAAEKKNNIGEKYLAGKYQLPFREINRMVSEIAGVPLPKMRLPDSVTACNAALLTSLSALTKKPPLWGMSKDQIRVMQMGFSADGSKAERELGVIYSPIRKAIEDAISSFAKKLM